MLRGTGSITRVISRKANTSSLRLLEANITTTNRTLSSSLSTTPTSSHFLLTSLPFSSSSTFYFTKKCKSNDALLSLSFSPILQQRRMISNSKLNKMLKTPGAASRLPDAFGGKNPTPPSTSEPIPGTPYERISEPDHYPGRKDPTIFYNVLPRGDNTDKMDMIEEALDAVPGSRGEIKDVWKINKSTLSSRERKDLRKQEQIDQEQLGALTDDQRREVVRPYYFGPKQSVSPASTSSSSSSSYSSPPRRVTRFSSKQSKSVKEVTDTDVGDPDREKVYGRKLKKEGEGEEREVVQLPAAGDSNFIDYQLLFDVLALPMKSEQVVKKLSLSTPILDSKLTVEEYFANGNRIQNEYNYNMLLRKQGEMGRLDLALETFAHYEKHLGTPNIRLYTSMFAALAKVKQGEAALKLYETMKRAGIKSDPKALSAVLLGLSRQGKLDEAFTLFSEETKRPTSSFSLSASISRPFASDTFSSSSLSSTSSSSEVQKAEMERKEEAPGILPDVIMYNNLITGCVRNLQLDRAWDTFRYMIMSGLKPDEVLYTTMIGACIKKGEIEKATGLFQELQNNGLHPTEVTFNSMILCCAKRQDYYEQAYIYLRQMKLSGFAPDRETFLFLLHAASKNGDLKGADMIVGEMDENKIPFDTIAYNSLLSVFARAIRYDDTKPDLQDLSLKRVTNLFSQLEEMHAKNYKDKDIIPSLGMGDSPHLIPKEKRRDHKTGYFLLNNRTLNTYIATFVEAKRTEEAEKLMKELFEVKYPELTPCLVTFTTLIKGFALQGDMENAVRIYNTFQQAAKQGGFLVTDYSVLHWMCYGYAKVDFLKASMQVMKSILDRGMQPHPTLLSFLRTRFKNSQEYSTALDAIRREAARKRGGFTPLVGVVEGGLSPEDKKTAERLYGSQTMIVPPPVNSGELEEERRKMEDMLKNHDFDLELEKKARKKAGFTSSPYAPNTTL